MPAHSAVSMVRTNEAAQRFRKSEVFLAGAIGALAPQILRWYTQWDGHGGVPDPLIAAGRAAVTLAFVALAGYVAMVWDVRSLKEGFLVGVGVPAVILGSGSDLASLAKASPASAQTLRVAAPSRDHGVARLIVQAVGDDGRQIPDVLLTATSDGDQNRVSGPRPLILRPGRYNLVIQARGYETEDRVIRLSPEQTLQFPVHLRPLSAKNRFLQGVREPFEQRSR